MKDFNMGMLKNTIHDFFYRKPKKEPVVETVAEKEFWEEAGINSRRMFNRSDNPLTIEDCFPPIGERSFMYNNPQLKHTVEIAETVLEPYGHYTEAFKNMKIPGDGCAYYDEEAGNFKWIHSIEAMKNPPHPLEESEEAKQRLIDYLNKQSQLLPDDYFPNIT